MSRSALRNRLGAAARVLPLGLVPLDRLLTWAHLVTAAIARLVFLRDWQLEAKGRPQFFKHAINLGRWAREPSRWSFTARGVYARQHMFRGCRVLDLCCGDGSYSYLFFSDIAGHIDAVDNDRQAIEYGRRFRAAPVIAYHKLDILNEAWPGKGYDVVVWNAAICYFTEAEIRQILDKIIRVGGPGMKLCGMLPKANGWIDHKTEFADTASLEGLLREYFAVANIRELDECTAITFYFEASQPLGLAQR